MKGQVTLEELLSFGVYLVLLSMLIGAVFTAKGSGEGWSAKTVLRAEAARDARVHDAFYNSNLHNPYQNWPGAGTGYIELGEGEGKIAVPVLAGRVEVAEGEPI